MVKNTSLAAKRALAHCLQRRTACKTQNGRRGLERGLNLAFWALPSTFVNKFFDLSTPSMRKGRDEGEKIKWGEKIKIQIMVEIVATNVVASKPPYGDQLQRRR